MSELELRSGIDRSARVMQLEGMFDLTPADETITRIAIDPLRAGLESVDDWSIGLIVGPSGAGKSQVAHALWPDNVDPAMEWHRDAAVIDEFPSSMGIKDVTLLLSSVGFSSPPAWLRPYAVLSNGEQFRVRMARLLAEHPEFVVVDEFTSVVDRTVAQIGSAAIARTIRSRGNRLVAVTCHYDVTEWLQPDWVYEPHIGAWQVRHLQPRPPINLRVIRADGRKAWPLFRPHHYLSADYNNAAHTFVGFIGDEPVVLCSALPLVGRYNGKRYWRVHRVVVVPDFQGVGIGNRFTTEVAANYARVGITLTITSSHPATIAGFNRSPDWMMHRAPSRAAREGATSTMPGMRHSRARVTAGFRYVGAPSTSLLGVVGE